jgi:virginiamycin B lyase
VTDEPSAIAVPTASAAQLSFEMQTYPVPAGSRPHDVAPAADGGIWYTGQGNGTVGWLDPESGEVLEISLGAGSAPHGVITGQDGAAWVTDGGLNAIVRVDRETDEITTYPLDATNANLNTATFDGDGILWFTGQNGIYGSLDPENGAIGLYGAPRGSGPYGIATTPDGEVYFSSLAGSYLGAIDRATGKVTVIDTPTAGGGARRVWPDSSGRLWVTEWFSGALAAYDPVDESWTEWSLPTAAPMPYAVYVDGRDAVWVTDFGANAILRFDPETEEWLTFEHESQPADVRQLLGRPGEVWGAESAADQLVVLRTDG